MRKTQMWLNPILIVLLVLSSVLPYLVPAAQVEAGGSDVTVTVGNVAGKPGDVVEVPVSIDAPASGIGYYTIDLAYDSEALELLIDEDTLLAQVRNERSSLGGTFLSLGGFGNLSVNWSNDDDVEYDSSKEVTSSGKLFTVFFKILQTDAGQMTVDVQPEGKTSEMYFNGNNTGGGTFQEAAVSYVNGSISINPITWIAGNATAPAGGSVSVPVSFSGLTREMSAYDVKLKYDSTKLEATGVTPLWGDDTDECGPASSEGCFVANTDEAGEVTVVWADSSGGDRPLTPAYTDAMFQVNFDVKTGVAPGDIPISFDSVGSSTTDQDGYPITPRYTDGKVTVVQGYTVTYYGNGSDGGAVPTDANLYEENGMATVLGNTDSLTKAGHTFEGWNTKADGTGTAYAAADTFTIEANTTLYAQWKINEYTVSFESDGGNAVNDQTIDYNKKAVEPTAPEKEGYIFSGWFTEDELENEYDFNTPVTSDITLYAKWTIEQYIVSFDSNGGTAVNDETIDHGDTVTKPADPEKEGYTFKGWYTDEQLETEYDFSTQVKAPKTLYGKWELNEYDVTFDVDGGTAVSAQSILHNEKATEPSAPTKTGYTFEGWYSDNAFETGFNFDTAIKKDTVIYANWTINEYDVTFNSEGGTAVNAQSIEYNKKAAEPDAPTKTGYTFAGWYEDADTEFSFDQLITEDTVVYAKWTINEYDVTFHVNGGTAVGKQSIEYNKQAAEPTAPEKTGYTFEGWYSDAEGESEFSFDTKITADTAVYAKWAPIPYMVTFESNTDTEVDPATVPYDSKITEPADLTKTGYTFAGWFQNEALTDKWNFDEDTMTGDITLYAKWTANPQTITFDTDGGSAVADDTVAYDDKITKPSDPTKAGHTFKGWFMDSEEWDFNKDIVKGNMTLTAQWEINEYTLSFDSNDGSAVEAQEVTYNEKAQKPSEPAKAGHTFAGWYADEALETEWNFDEDVVTEDVTLYAKWDINSYTVTFNANRGSEVAPATAVYNTTITKPENPTRPGYSFVNWYTDEQLRTAFDFTTPITGDMTLYARWSSNASPAPQPTTEDIVVDVVSGDETLVQTPIKRTTNPDGTVNDDVTFTPDKAAESVEKLKDAQNKTARIVIPDANDKVSETNIGVPQSAMNALANGEANLEIDTENARIFVPSDSITGFGDDLYFRVVPVKKEEEKQAIETRAKQEEKVKEVTGNNTATIQVLGRPMTIETNMQNRPVTLTLPLPANVSQEMIDNLAIFIEHSDGTKQVIRGTVVEWKNGQKGVQFGVDHFSTFTMLYLEEAATEETGTHDLYIHGFKDGTFRPDETVTRAQIAAMLVRNLDMTYNGKVSYKDTKASFAMKEIEMAREAGVILGFSDGTFRPDQAVTRAQVAAIASRWVDNVCNEDPNSALCTPSKEAAAFTDVAADHWAATSIKHASFVGIINGFGNGSFKPEQAITRAQAVVMLNRLFERGPLNGVSKPTFTDVPAGHWAFKEIEEAATTHDYEIDQNGNEQLLP